MIAMIGQTISHYTILEKLGGGGMGIVYKAQDVALDRFVALKFLPTHVAEDDDDRTRFLQEAKAASKLDHPNICTIHEIGEAPGGELFIAMAFYNGETVKKKIERGPLPLTEALDISRQTAQGLAKAHESGIVHRDIKPANIMVTEDGVVKIVDFGLAKNTSGPRITKSGMILGTAAYMAPEQVFGEPVDRRTDIWALGVGLYEALTARLPFSGDYEQALTYNITNEDPEPLTALRAGLPMELERLVSKCLAKDPAQRYQHADELVVDLGALRDQLKSGQSRIRRPPARPPSSGDPLAAPIDGRVVDAQQETATVSGSTRKGSKPMRYTLWGVLGVALLLLLALAIRGLVEAPPEAPLRQFAFTPAVAVGTTPVYSNVAISPNGLHIAFTGGDAEGKLWIQDLDRREPRELQGTDGARAPFWSPGSDFVGFAVGGELRKVSTRGDPPVRLCALPSTLFLGGSWSPDGETIVFSSNYPPMLYEIPARGGASRLLISGDQPQASAESEPTNPTEEVVWPHFLPAEAGERVVVFASGTPSRTSMVVQDLNSGRREILGPGSFPFYSSSGHILYQPTPRTYDLWALPFSLDTLKADGEAFPTSQDSRGPTVAVDQTLVYLDSAGEGQRQLVWRNRLGEKTGDIGAVQGRPNYPAISPDGRYIAVMARESLNEDLWIYDDNTPGLKTRLSTAAERDYRPVWAPGGEAVAFSSTREGSSLDILIRQTGGGEEEALLATDQTERICGWSEDGKYILYRRDDPANGNDLWYLERSDDGTSWEPHPYLQTPFNERSANISPDGRHVAYASNETGVYEIYVRPFPNGQGKSRVSTARGKTPRWSRDGKELFYVEGGTLMAVSVQSGPGFSVGLATRLFEHPSLITASSFPQYDVSADGQHIVLAEPRGGKVPELSIRVVQNWYAEFRDREQN